jgi:hypothetical protein
MQDQLNTLLLLLLLLLLLQFKLCYCQSPLPHRAIPLPTAADKYGLPVGHAVFFPVPRDSGSFDSYKPGGREGEWFMSKTYVMYQQRLQNLVSAAGQSSSSASGGAAAEAGLGALAEPQAAVSGPAADAVDAVGVTQLVEVDDSARAQDVEMVAGRSAGLTEQSAVLS